MKKPIGMYLFLIIALSCLVSNAWAQESITLSTYYPSPFGVYQQLKVGDTLQISPQGSATCDSAGKIYYNNSLGLQVCDGTSWSSSLGIWEEDGASMYPKNLALQVGIGTSAPNEMLQVEGNVELSGAARTIFMGKAGENGPFGLDFANAEAALFYDTVSNQLQFQNSSSAVLFSVDADDGVALIPGSLGIGSTAPATNPLEVTGNTQLKGNLIFGAANPTVTASSGNLSIATTGGNIALSPSANFTVASTGVTVTSSGNILNSLSGSTRFAVQNGGADVFTVQRTGFVGVGTTAPTVSGAELEVNGDVAANSFVYRPSTIKAKKNIHLVEGIKGIEQLRGVRYQLKSNGKHEIGVIAEDVEKVYPELVVSSPDSDMKGVKYGNLVAPLIEAVKEQQTMIENQQKEIDSLKKQMEVLKQKTF